METETQEVLAEPKSLTDEEIRALESAGFRVTDAREILNSFGENKIPTKKRFQCGFSQDWTAIFKPRRHNWIDFTFFHAHAELSRYRNNAVEAEIAFLGVHFWSTWS